MLMGCGALTASALMLFAASIKRIRYSTAGLMQYISPSLVFLTAVFVFGEPMDKWKLLSFVIIWIGAGDLHDLGPPRREKPPRRRTGAALDRIRF